MSSVRISLLGIVRVSHQGIPTESGMGRAVKGLLGYLTLFRHRFHAREVIAGLFWGESSENRARSSLSTTLCRLRKVLEPGSIPSGAYLVTAPTGEIGFNHKSDHWIDVEIFEDRIKPILTKSYESLTKIEVSQLESTVNLYNGELMEGFYDEWALRERERLRSLFVKGQVHLLHHYSHHAAWDKGLTCAQNILDLEPLHEEIHREMMRLYFKNGQRALALKQYETCRDTLASELEVSPMEETQILYAQISQNTGRILPPSGPQLNLISAHKLLVQLKRNIHDFEKSTEMLRRSAKNLEGAFRGTKTEDRRQKTEDRRQRTDDRRLRTDL
jgi:DNA-binding SARP family transcriptional activator